MTANKCIQKLLRFKGLKVVDFAFEGTRRLSSLVKPGKNKSPGRGSIREQHIDLSIPEGKDSVGKL